MRLRRLATSNPRTPARRPSTSTTKRAWWRGRGGLAGPPPPADPAPGAGAERDAREDEDEPERRVQRPRLVEDEDAVDERRRRQQVGDERRSRGAVEAEHPVEEEKGDGRGQHAERRDRPERLPARQLV